MKILWILNKELDISTSQASRHAMAAGLSKLGHQTRIVARYRHQRDTLGSSVPVVFLPRLNWPGLRMVSAAVALLFWLPSCLLRNPVNVVLIDRPLLVWWLVPCVIAMRVLRPRIKWILDVRSPPTFRKGLAGKIQGIAHRGGLRIAGWLFDGWSTITPALRDQVARSAGIPRERVGIWSSGVSTKRFDPSCKRLPTDWQTHAGVTVVYHGLLSSERALPEVIQALADLRNELPRLRLFLLGSGPAVGQLRKLVRELDVESQVVFHGPVQHDEVPSYLAAADIGLVPAPNTEWYRVSSPLKLMEYLAAGKPVIATDMEATRSVLRDRGDVVWVPCNRGERPRVTALAGALRTACQSYGAGFVSGRNRDIAEKELDWEVQVRRLESYLLRCTVGDIHA